ncbi:hypothetical protein P2Q00_24920 [Streptomyces coacervatus]|nr:hypothetical protein [Streptomyces coacervatus]MDF2268653.1 hypothetical protein [Streptomyces coacervatus]
MARSRYSSAAVSRMTPPAMPTYSQLGVSAMSELSAPGSNGFQPL